MIFFVFSYVILLVSIIYLVYFLIVLLKQRKQLKGTLEKYVPIEQINDELEKLRKKRDSTHSAVIKLSMTERVLKDSVSKLEEQEYLQECGFYEPHYNFENLIEYERKLKNIRKKQKSLITNMEAVECSTDYHIDGSASKGEKFVKKLIKVILQAFNGECDAAVLKVTYKNIVTLESRIEKLFHQLNKNFSDYELRISGDYLSAKIAELRIVHEFNEKKEEEKQEQRRIKEIMREEFRAEKEMEKAKAEAEKEERRYQAALEQARVQVELAKGAQHDRMMEKIAELEARLEQAKNNKERAISRAQLTKSGHVYIISNIGSFGEDVLKIGMTRRLEPMDRVKELGDASVPFSFDVHAMIYSENAPELENNLHKELESYQINKVNNRKEFFKVELDKVEKVAKKFSKNILITKIAEAKEYRQSLAKSSENDPTALKSEEEPDVIVFYCSHCEQKLEAPKDWAGMELSCPSCDKEIMVPSS